VIRGVQGYGVIFDPDIPQPWERDTVNCRHCNRVIFVKPGSASTVYQIQGADGVWREEAGAWCGCCHGPVCLQCDADGRCLPFEAKLAKMEGQRVRSLTIAVP